MIRDLERNTSSKGHQSLSSYSNFRSWRRAAQLRRPRRSRERRRRQPQPQQWRRRRHKPKRHPHAGHLRGGQRGRQARAPGRGRLPQQLGQGRLPRRPHRLHHSLLCPLRQPLGRFRQAVVVSRFYPFTPITNDLSVTSQSCMVQMCYMSPILRTYSTLLRAFSTP